MTRVAMFRPFVNDAAIARVTQTLRSGWIGEGPATREFEGRIAMLTGAPHAVAVNSGTTALHLALVLAGVQPGDEVITTAQTMLATTTAILMAGATPVYADVQYGTGNLDPVDIERRVTGRTRAILAVDWRGYPCDWDEIRALAAARGLTAIEDAAHSIGAKYRGRPVGAICDYTCLSFQAIKHLTTGDGGMVLLRSEPDDRRARRLRWFGIDRERRQASVLGEPQWNVSELGYKYHMNDVAASIGLGNLDDFDANLARRRQIAASYRRRLAGVPGLKLFEASDDRDSAEWLFSVHVERREAFCRALRDRDVEASVVHLRIDRNELCGGERPDLPELARFTESHVSLPLHPFLTDDEVDRVVAAVEQGW